MSLRVLLVDDEVLAQLGRLNSLAPLHQPHNLAAIRALLARLPGVPEIACFDTAFHRTVPDVAQRFALPPRLGLGPAWCSVIWNGRCCGPFCRARWLRSS
jgi:acetate kinase